MNKELKFLTLLILIINSLVFKTFGQSGNNINEIEKLKELPRLYFEEVVNKKNLYVLPRIFSEDYVFHETNGEDSRHMKNNTLVPHLNYLFKAFPDLVYKIDFIIAENDMVALYTTATGTHANEFLGFASKGKKVTYKHMFLFRISDDKIVEGWGVVDRFGLEEQLK